MKRERHTYLTLQTVEAARQGWLDRISAEGRELATERVPLSAALHRVLAEPVAARRSSPAFHGAAMDGIAVNAESTFTASTRRPLRLTIGTDAFWINTGHPLPAGTNAVVMVENVNTEIAECLIGMNVLDQTSIDKALIDLDGTPNKS